MMRRFALIAVGTIIALLALALIVPYVLPASAYKGRIEAAARAATGRQLVIAGPLRFSVIPVLGIQARAVRLENAPDAPGGRDFISMRALTAGVRFWPLLSGTVEITAITFDRPVIHLTIGAQGRANWQLPAGPAAAATNGGGAGGPNPEFSGIFIKDGTIIYTDTVRKIARHLNHIQLAIALSRLDAPVRLSGKFIANGQKIAVNGRVSSLAALRSGAPAQVDLSITSSLIEAGFKGTLARHASAGQIKLVTPDLGRLLTWAGKPVAAASTLGRLSLEGRLEVKGPRERFRGLKLVLDHMTIAGEVSYDGRTRVPTISGTLTADDLNLNRFLSAPRTQPQSGARASAPPSGWSRAPINLGLLGAANADLALMAKRVELRNLKLGATQMQLQLNAGTLVAKLDPLALYGGHGRLAVTVRSDAGAADYSSSFALADVQAQPLLHDALGVNRIEGIADLSYKVTARGQSPDAIMHSLAGSGRIALRDGRIRGVDLVHIARQITRVLGTSAIAATSQQATPFTTMGGSFLIANGVMSNKDFELQSPLLHITGAGTINVGARTLDFVVKPLAEASLTGSAKSGIGVPFRVHGPWAHLKYTPDLSGVAQSILNDVTHSGLSTKSVLKGFLGGIGGSVPKTPHRQKSKPLELLNHLLGGH